MGLEVEKQPSFYAFQDVLIPLLERSSAHPLRLTPLLRDFSSIVGVLEVPH